MDSDRKISYDLNAAWPVVEPSTARDCLERIVRLRDTGRLYGYHGAYNDWGCISSSLDVHFREEEIPPERRLDIETRLLETFAEAADPHFSGETRRHIEVARLRWRKIRTTGTLFVGRHFGLPTRCVDWTSDCLTGLFFACRRQFDKPGVLWWMDNMELSDRLQSQWKTVYGKDKRIEDDFEQDFIKGEEKQVLLRLFYANWMERPIRQNAWITVAGQYDVNHDEAIHRLGVRKCGRILIQPSLKQDLLRELNRLGVGGSTLGLGDGCVETIAADVAQSLGKGELSEG